MKQVPLYQQPPNPEAEHEIVNDDETILGLLICESNCKAARVVAAIDPENSIDYPDLNEKFFRIARNFDISRYKCSTLWTRYTTHIIGLYDVYVEVLENWRQVKSHEATLGKLIDELENQNLHYSADRVRREFHLHELLADKSDDHKPSKEVYDPKKHNCPCKCPSHRSHSDWCMRILLIVGIVLLVVIIIILVVFFFVKC